MTAVLLHNLDSQRHSGRFCDVVLKCGSSSSFAHGCVLAAVSGFFERVLLQQQQQQPPGGHVTAADQRTVLQVEVEELFEGMEHLLDDVLSYLYLGRGLQLDETLVEDLRRKWDLRGSTEEEEHPGEVMEEFVTEVIVLEKDEDKRKMDDVRMDVSFCHKCDLLFISKEEFLTHRMLNCTRKFTCQTCGTMFSRVQTLLEHLVEVRHGETVCSVCEQTCHSSNEMVDHVKRHLSQPTKPYFCLQCDSRFGSRYALAHHVPKHSVETPFVCQVCTKGFKWKHALTSHMITHSNDKKFLCQDCGFATSV